MTFRNTLNVTELATDEFEMFVDSVEAIPKISQRRLQNKCKPNPLTSIKVYEVRRLPKFCKSMKFYKKEIEIPVNYSDSEEDESERIGSLIRTSSIRRACRKRNGDTSDSNLGKLKTIQLKRGRGLRFNKEGYAYRMWKNIINIGVHKD